MSCGLRVGVDVFSTGLKQELRRLDELWTQGLSRFGGPFLAGSTFTAVDALYAPVAFRSQTCDLPLSSESHAYVRRLIELPSMQAWYQAALQEPWRDEQHEAEARQAGTWLADFRHTVV